MRDCIFLAAASQIAAMLTGFFGRQKFHLSLGCGIFHFEAEHDIIVDPNSDPGVYSRGFELLARFKKSHRRAVAILDADWEGSPGAVAIQKKIAQDLSNLWNDYNVIVLDPELEIWVWQDNQHVIKALGASSYALLRSDLEANGLWNQGASKPHKPKEAVDFALRRARIPRSAALYGQIASKVSVRSCVDPAFLSLSQCFNAWFR